MRRDKEGHTDRFRGREVAQVDTHSLTRLNVTSPMSHRMIMIHYRMLQCRMAFGSRLDMTGLVEYLPDCVLDWGNMLILVAHNCVGCIVEFCMVAELWLWRQGKSEREWTSERKE